MASINQIGIYLPEKVVTNDDLKNEFPNEDFTKFEKTVGIKSRHVAAENETALDLGEKASQKVLAQAKNPAVDYLLFCTQTPDYHAPGNAGILQDRLGLDKNMGAHDFNLGCSGYVYGLALAKGLIDSNICTRVLFVVSDTFSKYIHPKDRANRAIFGDGASATIIENGSKGIGEFVFGTDGSGYDQLIIPNGGCRNSQDLDAEEYEYGSGNITDDNHLFMDGLEVFSFTTKIVPKLVTNTLEKNNLQIEDIDHFVFHQANEYMLNFLRKKLNIPEEKFYIDITHTGNTSGCTIPIALQDLRDQGRIRAGQNIMLAGYGIGLSWAGVIIRT